MILRSLIDHSERPIDVEELLKIGYVCRGWYYAINFDELWRRVTLSRGCKKTNRFRLLCKTRLSKTEELSLSEWPFATE
jgi:hypothetical protein